jgi:hypothetical protein
VTSWRSRSIQCTKHSTQFSELRQNALKSIPRFRGRVAQLAEHLLCKQGVGSSSLPTSTIILYNCAGGTAWLAAWHLSFGGSLDSEQVGVDLLVAVLGGPQVEGNERQFIHDRHSVPIFS